MGNFRDLGGLEKSVAVIPEHIMVFLSSKHEEAVNVGADGGIYMGNAYRCIILNMVDAVQSGTPELPEQYLQEIKHATGGTVDKIVSRGYLPQPRL